MMNPRSRQKPRPPLMIAAMGPVMLKRAAESADIWNSVSFAATFEAQLEETRVRIDQINEHCVKLGRDPDAFLKSYQMFDPNARTSGGLFNYYDSEDLFVDMAHRLTELSIRELGLYYPMVESQIPMFEKIAREVVPKLRKSFDGA
jgi:hypothetical protein